MAERGRGEAFSKGKKEITVKLNMLGTVGASLNEICEIEHGVDLVDGETVSLVKIVIFLPLHSQPCSLFKY